MLLRLKIPQNVGNHYSNFGTFLLNDDTGSLVSAIELECAKEPARIVKCILSEWLQGRGSPVGWKSLIRALEDADLKIFACKVKESYSSYSKK